jgi:hypothetical protein
LRLVALVSAGLKRERYQVAGRRSQGENKFTPAFKDAFFFVPKPLFSDDAYYPVK